MRLTHHHLPLVGGHSIGLAASFTASVAGISSKICTAFCEGINSRNRHSVILPKATINAKFICVIYFIYYALYIGSSFLYRKAQPKIDFITALLAIAERRTHARIRTDGLTWRWHTEIQKATRTHLMLAITNKLVLVSSTNTIQASFETETKYKLCDTGNN